VTPAIATTNVLAPEQFAFPLSPLQQPAPGFELLDELGRGGMGVVYKARQTALNRIVALKMVVTGFYSSDVDRLRFLAEAEAVAAVKHPNVVQVYEFGHNAGLPYFAMEFLNGGSLAALLFEHGPMGPTGAARVVEQVARGVQAAHDVGVVHRDLKPANILFGGFGIQDSGFRDEDRNLDSAPNPESRILNPKVTDFGLAKRGGGYDLTMTGVVMGTPAYMAPEQAKGEGKFVGPAADIYGLGALLYEALTGRPPFLGEDPSVLMIRLVNEDPLPVRRFAPAVPRDLERICMKCLEKAPADRYPSAAALADDLARFLNGEPVSVHPAGLLEKAVKWVRRSPARAALYGITLFTSALIGLTAGVVKVWRETEFNRRQTEVALDFARQEQVEAEQAQAEADAAKIREAEAHAALAAVLAEPDRATRRPVLKRAVSPDGLRVARVNPDGGLTVGDATGGRDRAIRPPGAQVVAVGWSADGSSLLILDASGTLSVHPAGPPG
jgi:hypothetical protein